MTAPLDLTALRAIVDRQSTRMVELAPDTAWGDAEDIGKALAVFPALLSEVESLRRVRDAAAEFVAEVGAAVDARVPVVAGAPVHLAMGRLRAALAATEPAEREAAR